MRELSWEWISEDNYNHVTTDYKQITRLQLKSRDFVLIILYINVGLFFFVLQILANTFVTRFV